MAAAAGSRRPSRATPPIATPSSVQFDVEPRIARSPDRPRDVERRRDDPGTRQGRLVLADRVATGRIRIEDGRIAVDGRRAGGPHDGGAVRRAGVRRRPRPRLGRPRRDGRPRGARRHGPRAPAPRRDLVPADGRDGAARRRSPPSRTGSGAGCRARRRTAPSRSGSTSRARSWPRPGAAPTTRPHLRVPADVAAPTWSRSLDGLRVITIAPELPGALELIALAPRARGVATSMGHSAASVEEARAGYAAGAISTTHLFNAMSGIDHGRRASRWRRSWTTRSSSSSSPTASTSIPALWPLITRLKPRGPAAARERRARRSPGRATAGQRSAASRSRSSGDA